MPLLSSPIAYPPSSSPPLALENRKRKFQVEAISESKKRLLGIEVDKTRDKSAFRTPASDGARIPLESKETQHNRPSLSKGPFVDDDSEDDVESHSIPALIFRPGCVRSKSISIERMPITGAGPDDSFTGSSRIKTSSGKIFRLNQKLPNELISYEQSVARQSAYVPGKAAKSFYGVDIHKLMDQAAKESKLIKETSVASDHEALHPSIEAPLPSKGSNKGRTMLWTEKYRARKFIDLVGDERTHRDLLRWIKGWDPIVFPGMRKPKPKSKLVEDDSGPYQQRKILLLTGPPGLGKTTLAHVCARQAGYEVVEINASDERSSGVVKGRIRDCVGTENVKGINAKDAGGTTRKAGRPVCVVIDEVDGVVSGSSGSGEGGFIKALIELAALDQKNSNVLGSVTGNSVKPKRKGDRFRLLRPMILICNDIYHPAIRPLRTSSIAEVIHIRKPPLDKVVARLKTVFDRENVACDGDGVRRLCEATWGISNRREARHSSTVTGEGDMRGILVVGEWVAAKIRASRGKDVRLTKRWVEDNMMESLAHGGGGSRDLGRGGAKEAVERVFLDGAGFPMVVSAPTAVEDFGKIKDGNPIGVPQLAKRASMDHLRDMIDMSGESDRILTDCFATYLTHSWQDDTLLSKPNAAYEWLHFYDRLSSKVHVGQDWELAPYLSQSILGFHHLFASPTKQSWASDQNQWDDNEEPMPFSGPRADHSASEALKQNKAILLGLQSSLSIPLLRSFRSAQDIAVDLLPQLIRMLTPDVKPIIAGGSGDQRGVVSVRKEGERAMIERAVGAMSAVGVTFERVKVESGQSGTSTFAYRMDPPLDDLSVFETGSQASPAAPARYAVRQALDQEYQKYLVRQSTATRLARYKAGEKPGDNEEAVGDDKESSTPETLVGETAKRTTAVRDFFGRIIEVDRPSSWDISEKGDYTGQQKPNTKGNGRKVWVSFHEGFSNAVRKPITLEELMRGF
ncbi:chromosome transmission fidelity protein 18, partial [Lecanoromycetidae sp. Uapishka_2]